MMVALIAMACVAFLVGARLIDLFDATLIVIVILIVIAA